MAKIVPTRMIGVPLHALIVNHAGSVSEVGAWTKFLVDAPDGAVVCRRIIDGQEVDCDPDELVALIVPSTQDAVMALIATGFQIKSAEVLES